MDVHAQIDTDWSTEALATLFTACGWRARRCTWVDWEITSDAAELIIEATEPPRLIHGSFEGVPPDLVRIFAPLTDAGLFWHAECYVEGRLVQEIRSADRL